MSRVVQGQKKNPIHSITPEFSFVVSSPIFYMKIVLLLFDIKGSKGSQDYAGMKYEFLLRVSTLILCFLKLWSQRVLEAEGAQPLFNEVRTKNVFFFLALLYSREKDSVHILQGSWHDLWHICDITWQNVC